MNTLQEYPVVYEQKVAWGDMDAFGHVNNVVYYRYIESARICYFDKLSILNEDIYAVVASSECKYLKPIFYPDLLKIGVRIDELRNSAFRMHYSLWSTQLNCVVALGEAVIVCVDKKTMNKIQIPIHIKEHIQSLELEFNHKI